MIAKTKNGGAIWLVKLRVLIDVALQLQLLTALGPTLGLCRCLSPTTPVAQAGKAPSRVEAVQKKRLLHAAKTSETQSTKDAAVQSNAEKLSAMADAESSKADTARWAAECAQHHDEVARLADEQAQVAGKAKDVTLHAMLEGVSEGELKKNLQQECQQVARQLAALKAKGAPPAPEVRKPSEVRLTVATFAGAASTAAGSATTDEQLLATEPPADADPGDPHQRETLKRWWAVTDDSEHHDLCCDGPHGDMKPHSWLK